eukprot:14934196-Alexandrium_andersonii.AAC.2
MGVQTAGKNAHDHAASLWPGQGGMRGGGGGGLTHGGRGSAAMVRVRAACARAWCRDALACAIEHGQRSGAGVLGLLCLRGASQVPCGANVVVGSVCVC